MTEDQKIIWAAGFFDGEGCVAICRQNHKRYNPSYTLHIAVSQKDPAPLHVLQELFGGHLYAYTIPKTGLQYWRWHMGGNGAMATLRRLGPFLILKQQRAGIAIDFQSNLVVWNRDFGRRGYPDAVNALRVEFFERMAALNRRGVAAGSEPNKPGPRKFNPASLDALRRGNKKLDDGKEIQAIN